MNRVFIISIVLVLALVISGFEQPSDLHQADAQLQNLFNGDITANLDKAAALYVDIIAGLDTDLEAGDEVILNRHLAQLSLILPAGMKAQISHKDSSSHALLFSEGSGEDILRWWRSQDVLPASRVNERMYEHLARIAYAQQRFFYMDRVSKLDDRGEVYVKLGEPEIRQEIKYNGSKLVDELFRPGVSLTPSDFSRNEVWQYGHVNRSTYYIFVERNKFFQISGVEHLVPAQLRMGYSASRRGVFKSSMMIALLRSIFRQLEPIHPDFAMRYLEVDEYARRLEEEAIDSFVGDETASRSTGQNAELNVGSSSTDLRRGAIRTSQLANGSTLKPNDFVQQMMFRSQSEDLISDGLRRRNTPDQYSEVLDEKEKLEVIPRVLRYLDADRTTRTEIHWSPVAGSLTPSRVPDSNLRDYIIRVTAVQQFADFNDRVVNQNHYMLKDVGVSKDLTIPVQKMVVSGDTNMYHLALQWDQHAVISAANMDNKALLGPQLKVSTHRMDSMQALVSDPAVLEMSDIKPIMIIDEELIPDVESAAEAPAYPFETIRQDQLFAIYFEVYNLTFGTDDLTSYEVNFEVVRKKDGFRLFSGRNDKTNSRADYSGVDRTARDMILLDLEAYEDNGSLELRVDIKDKTSGQQVYRTLSFEVI
ncbi:MAG: GWxTD domain-containing protein [Rhodothermales bacterium]